MGRASPLRLPLPAAAAAADGEGAVGAAEGALGGARAPRLPLLPPGPPEWRSRRRPFSSTSEQPPSWRHPPRWRIYRVRQCWGV